MGAFVYLIKPFGVSHIHNAHITIIYHSLFAYIGFKLFQIENKAKLLNLSKKHILYVLTTFLIYGLFTSFADIIPLSEVKEAKLMELEFHYPLFTLRGTLSKGSELVFQQVLILGFLISLKANNVSDRKNFKLFGLSFFILHLPLFMVFGWYGLIFIIPSAVGGFFFAYLILFVKKGIVWSFLLHQSFYVLGSVLYRLI